MNITTINGKPVLSHNKITLGTFNNQAQAQRAASEVEPLLKEKGIGVIPMMISVIQRNGGK